MKKLLFFVLFGYSVSVCAMDSGSLVPDSVERDVYGVVEPKAEATWEILGELWQSALDARDAGIAGAVWMREQAKKHWVATSLVCLVAAAVFFYSSPGEELRSKINDFFLRNFGEHLDSYEYTTDCHTTTPCARMFCTIEEKIKHLLSHDACNTQENLKILERKISENMNSGLKSGYECIVNEFKRVEMEDYVATDVSPSMTSLENFPSSWGSFEAACAACFARGGWLLKSERPS